MSPACGPFAAAVPWSVFLANHRLQKAATKQSQNNGLSSTWLHSTLSCVPRARSRVCCMHCLSWCDALAGVTSYRAHRAAVLWMGLLAYLAALARSAVYVRYTQVEVCLCMHKPVQPSFFDTVANAWLDRPVYWPCTSQQLT